MRSPLDDGPWLFLETVSSTQDEAALRLGAPDCPGIVFADHQERGRGRFGRTWLSEPGSSLTMSLVYRCYAKHPRPWLLGMAVSLAVARTVHGQVRWPNDIVIKGQKVAGVLTELLPAADGAKVPVIGVGVNLLDAPFLAKVRAAAVADGKPARELARLIVEELPAIPEPTTWSAISQLWLSMDDTPGKPFRLPTGELAVAIRVGQDGALVCLCDGQERTVFAADAVIVS